MTRVDGEARFEPFPLRDVQEAYWIGRGEGFTLGNVAAYGYYEYAGRGIAVERLDAAWRQLIARHDMLRMIVRPDGRQQILAHTPPCTSVVHDLRALPDAEAEDRLAAVRRRLSHQRLAYDRWPIFIVEVSLLPGDRARVHFGVDFIWCDAWSFRLLIQELSALYRDPAARLPPLSCSFRDYVLAEQRLRESSAYERAWQYWSARLDDLPPAPPLPVAREPDDISQPRFGRIVIELTPVQWRALRSRAGAARLTPTAVLLAVYSEVLALYGGESRFTINLTLFSRLPLHEHVERLVGDFTSLVPLVVDGRGRPSFVELARRIQGQLWRDIDHRLAAGPRLMRELARRLGTARAGLLPIVFTSLLGIEEEVDANEPLLVQDRRYALSQTPQVWLDFIVLEAGGGLYCAWQYVEELFPAETVAGLVESFSRRLNELADPHVSWEQLDPVAVLPHQRARREQHVLTEPVPAVRLEELFLRRAAEQPTAPAVITPSRTLAYSELAQRSALLAARLVAHGCRQRVVAVVMEKGWEQVVAVLAILRAGAAYVPIDPALPASRLQHLLSETDTPVVLTQSWVDERLSWPAHVARIAVDGLALEAVPASASLDCSASDLAYVIFTSGSTGLPKGVMISHRGAVNTIVAINRMAAITARDRVLSVSSLSFDLSVYDIFGTLAAGAAVVFPGAAEHPEPMQWIEAIGEHGVTIWNSVPALLQLVLEAAPGDEPRLATLRLAMLSGDWIPVALPAHLRGPCPSARVLAMGGATEASIWSNYKWIDAVDPAWTSIPYGRPLPNQSLLVLDGDGRECPIWTAGELYIGGAGVALGYWRDAERTSASFVRDPATGEPRYRTGDFARCLPDGEVEFLGRRDTQVKIGGHRIELGEIEQTLAQRPDIRSCVVAAMDDGRQHRTLVAYVVPATVPHPGAEPIRAELAARLPAYLVPRSIVFMDRLPLTANGKVDRAALPRPAATAGDTTTTRLSATPPITAAEQLVAGFWSQVLRLDGDVGVDADFFELGGDSLAATRVITRVNDAFGCKLSVGALFEHPTIAGLCALGSLDAALATQARANS